MYRVCPHIEVPSDEGSDIRYDSRALAVSNLSLRKLHHLATCLPADGLLKRAIATRIAERTLKQFSLSRTPPLADADIEEHYNQVFSRFGLERRRRG